MYPDIKKIIEAGIQAPSGENSQPWRFEVENFRIKLINNEESDQSLYNFKQRGSFIAQGAVLENIKIASANFGYTATIQLFPDSQRTQIVAYIDLKKSLNPMDSLLYPYIFKRVTNRKPYKNLPLTKEEFEELTCSEHDKIVKVHFTDNTQNKILLGMVGSTNEEIMLGNRRIHNFFFSHINWNKEEDNRKKVGFFIDTLELPSPAKIMFKLMKNWSIMNIFLKLNFHKIVGKQNAFVNSQAAGFFALSITDLSKESFVEVGMFLERMWLISTKLGLSMQPLTGVLFFIQRVNALDVETFSLQEIQLIKKAYNKVQTIFNTKDNETITFMFRIGHGEDPSARSSRLGIEEVSKTSSA